MKNFTTINLKRLNSQQSMEFITDFLKAAGENEKVAAKFTNPISSLQSANEELNRQIQMVGKSYLTVDVWEAKANLSKAYSALYNTVRAMSIYPPSDAAALSLRRLLILLQTYGVDSDIETTTLKNMTANVIEDLSSDAYSGDVKTSGVEMLVKSLMHVHDVFSAKLLERTGKAILKGERHLKESRVKAEKSYRDLIGLINASVTMEATTDYDAFIDSWNLVVQYYKQTVIAANKRAKTISKNKKQEEAPDATTEVTDIVTDEAGEGASEDESETLDTQAV